MKKNDDVEQILKSLWDFTSDHDEPYLMGAVRILATHIFGEEKQRELVTRWTDPKEREKERSEIMAQAIARINHADEQLVCRLIYVQGKSQEQVQAMHPELDVKYLHESGTMKMVRNAS